MKTKIVKLAAILLTTLFLTISCDNKETPPEEKFPRDIPFTEFSLEGTSCRWVNVPDGGFPFEIVIINSNEELEKQIRDRRVGENCTIEDIPAIDFSKYTLLLARGNIRSGVSRAYCYSLQQLTAQHYEMRIFVSGGELTVIGRWFIPIIVDKLDEEATVELIATFEN